MKLRLNPILVAKQNLTPETIGDIEALHYIKRKLIRRMKRSKKPETLKSLAADVTAIEFGLQDAWGFPRDIRYHKFWELPGCSCAKMDNYDAWPTGYYSRSQNCPIHGW